MSPEMMIDVEEPHQPLATITLARAIQVYMLDSFDIKALRDGEIVWFRDISLTKHEDIAEAE